MCLRWMWRRYSLNDKLWRRKAPTLVFTMPEQPCELLPWDTEFFGFRVARTRTLVHDENVMARVDHWCDENKIALLYHLTPSNEPQEMVFAHGSGFGLVDVRMTFERSLMESDETRWPSASVRAAVPGDLTRLEAITSGSFLDTRFYADRNIPRDKCDLLYRTWIWQSVAGKAGAVFVNDVDGDVAGYITCDVNGSRDVGSIGLMAVDRSRQRSGVGKALVNHALRWFAGEKVSTVNVVTQARNVGAQRLYQRCGFLTSAVEMYYHKWYRPPLA